MSSSRSAVPLSPIKRRRINASSSESSISEISSIHSNVSSLLQIEGGHHISFDGTSYLQELSRPKASGLKFELFKPAAKKGLYNKLIKNYNEIEHVVKGLVERIQENFGDTFKILQIIPDMLLIDFNITSYSIEENAESIGEIFLQAATRQINTQEQKCIFNHTSKYAKDLSNIIDYFLWHLCQKLTDTQAIIPLAHKVFKVFTCFLRAISKGTRLVLRLVAYVFAFRINKFLCIRRIQLFVNEHDETASALANACYDIIDRNNIDNIYDAEGRNLIFKWFYLEYASVMHVCFVAAPVLFANAKNFNMISSLLSSGLQTLSVATIHLCMKLIKHNELIPVLTGETFIEVIDIIEDLIFSTHHKEQVLAANFFTLGLKRGIEFAKRMTTIKALVSHCYYPNLIVAEACGEAMAVFLSNHGYLAAYKLLYSFATGFEHNTFGSSKVVKYSYLVEALHKHYEHLGWLYLLLALTSETDLSVDEYQMVAEMLYHVTYVKIKGFTEYEREGRKVSPNPDPVAHGKFVQKALANLNKIITIAPTQCDATSITWVIKTIDLVEEQCRVLSLTDLTSNAIIQFVEMVRNNQEKKEDLWSACIHLFRTIMNVPQPTQLSIKMRAICEDLFKSHIEEYEQNMATMEEAILHNYYPDIKDALVTNLLKIRIMLKHDICEEFNMETFLNHRWNELPEEVFIELVNCTIECIRKHLEKFTTETDPTLVLDIHDKAMKIWNFINDIFYHSPEWQEPLYLAMGILVYNYKINILRVRNISFRYYDNWRSKDIMDFVYRKCFDDVVDGTPLATKRLYISHFFTLFDVPNNLHRNTLYFVCSQHHKEYERYGSVFETYWNLVRDISQQTYFNKMVNVLCLEENQDHPYWEVIRITNFEELLVIYLDIMSPADKVAFLKYVEDYYENHPSRIFERHIKVMKTILNVEETHDDSPKPASVSSRAGSGTTRAPSVASEHSSTSSRPASASSKVAPAASRTSSTSSRAARGSSKAKPGPSKPTSD